MGKNLRMEATLQAAPEAVYHAWLDGGEHSRFTGSPATIDNRVHGRFTAWDGYIHGSIIELVPQRKIVQAWRTTEFPKGSPDSRVEIILSKAGKGTKLLLIHSDIPEGQEDDYEQGWKDFYFTPMKKYFARKR
jgi:activator of HSP90 ATPase